jgi:hypothetical protein
MGEEWSKKHIWIKEVFPISSVVDSFRCYGCWPASRSRRVKPTGFWMQL